MDIERLIMKVQVVDSEVKFWVIRPGEKAKYFNHFTEHNVVALGHIDHIADEEGIIEEVDHAKLKQALTNFKGENRDKDEAFDKDLESAQISSAAGQVSTFVNDVKIGDLIITLNSTFILIGTVTSDAYVEDSELKVLRADGNGYADNALSYKLRRNVVWGERKKREIIPKPIKPCFSPSQTLFSISEHNLVLFTHWLYSIYIIDGRLHFSTKINEPDNISHFNLTEFQRAIQKLELITKRVLTEDVEISENLLSDLEVSYLLDGVNNEFTLTTKNSFLSEGNIWSGIEGNTLKLAVFSMLLGSLFSTPIEASEEVSLTVKQKAFMQHTVKLMKDDGNFELFKKGIQASLDKPNTINRKIEVTEPANTTRLVFPKLKKEGDVGL